MTNTQPLVSVVLLTYNQQDTIRQAIDCILAQQTDYPFELIIGEDFGTDNTRSICQEYVEKYDNVRFPIADKNLGVAGNFVNCITQAKGKYIIDGAGDDYWHNPRKIQIQIDFMEQHPECVVSYTDIDVLHVKTGRIVHNEKQSKGINPPQGRIQNEILAGTAHISAGSLCFRKDAFDKYIPVEKFYEFPREDWPLLLILSAHGDVRYIPVSTMTYRTGQESITNTRDYNKICHRMQQDKAMTEYLYTMFPEWGPIDQGTIDYFENEVYNRLLLAAYEKNDYASAKQFAAQAPRNTMAKRMTKTWLTFQIFRFYRIFKS